MARIMIAEDNQGTNKAICEYMKSAGHMLYPAMDGAQSNSFDELADDYITKPFSMLILGKRITALLRRATNKATASAVSLGSVTVDFAGYTATDENGKIDITPKELEILKVLIDNKGLVLSRNQIIDDVWGYDCDVIDRTIDAYIRNIRKKLRLDCITTVKGIGYKFEMEQTQ